MIVSNRRLMLYSVISTGIAFLATVSIHPHGVFAAGYAGTSGVVNIHQMGGNIDVPDAPQGADLSTMGGAIHVRNASFVTAKTMGGDIAIDRASGAVDASTMGGKVTIRQAAGPIHASTMAGDVTAHLIGASTTRREVKLSSMAGTIVLTVPRDFGMDVSIKLAYTKNSAKNFRIIQHLGLTERESTDWDTSGGIPRKYILARGRVGDGLNPVTIDTINGDVVLRQD